ncbi:MAG: hypothetical protein PHR06_03975 [Candidatus Cloacimonetes bacterium]|nr:hypothetical protein [Candidatus Cloacimonadota bacterium]
MRRFLIALSVLILALLVGCASMSTSKSQYLGIDKKLMERDYASALAQIESEKEKGYTAKDRVLFYLDAGMLAHYNKEYTKSNEYLTQAENAIEELFTKSISKGAASLLLNDNALEYSGEDYEDIYLNVFKALNFIELNNFDAAFVEIRRINHKLNMLEDKYKSMADQYNQSEDKGANFEIGKNQFHNCALGRYLSMLLYRAEHRFDDANIDLQKIKEAWQLQKHIYDFSRADLSDALSATDKAKINIVSFIGNGPEKKANTLYIHTEQNQIIIASTEENPRNKQALTDFDVIYWPGVSEGYHFKLQLPYMEKKGSDITKIKVYIDDRYKGELERIESLENVAFETYKIKEPIIYLKTITRTIVKGLLSEKAKSEMTKNVDNPLASFLMRTATDIAVDATENADLRISRFFPAFAHIGEFEVDPGEHTIRIDYINSNGAVSTSDILGTKNVSAGGLNLYETYHLD